MTDNSPRCETVRCPLRNPPGLQIVPFIQILRPCCVRISSDAEDMLLAIDHLAILPVGVWRKWKPASGFFGFVVVSFGMSGSPLNRCRLSSRLSSVDNTTPGNEICEANTSQAPVAQPDRATDF